MANVIINKEHASDTAYVLRTAQGCNYFRKRETRCILSYAMNVVIVWRFCPQALISMPDYDENEIIEFEKSRANIDPDDFVFKNSEEVSVNLNGKIKKLIGMKDNEEFILSFVLGYPNVEYQRTVNRKPADVRIV